MKEIYLFDRLDAAVRSEGLKYLKCVVFIRPTEENIKLLCNELRYPKYGIYYICKFLLIIIQIYPINYFTFSKLVFFFQILAILYLKRI